jgi:hypothetical protein
MAHGGTAQDRLLRQGDGLGGGERTGQPRAERFVPGLPVDDLDDPAEQHVAAVAIGVRRARREHRRDLGQQADVALHAVVAPVGVGEHVAVDPAGVGEQVPHRHLATDIRRPEPRAGQHLRDGRVQRQQPLVDELHDHRGGPELGDGPDLEHRVGGDRDLCRGVEHAVRGQDLLPVGPDTQRSPGDVRFSGQFIEADGPVSGIEHDMDANSPKPGLTLTAR